MKYFKENIDYILSNTELAPPHGEASLHGGHNKQKIMMNLRIFKDMCLRANTVKSSEVRNYFLDLEESLFDNSQRETCILKEQVATLTTQVKQRRKRKYHPGKSIYILRSSNTEYFKLGSTINLDQRMIQYTTGVPEREEYYYEHQWYTRFRWIQMV